MKHKKNCETTEAPTTSESSTILSPTKVRLILEVLRYFMGFLIQAERHIYVSVNYAIINLDIAWYWTNADLLLIGSSGTNWLTFKLKYNIFHTRKLIWKCSSSILS